MSSRALRRAQRELEEKQAQERLAQEEQDEDESEEDIAPKASAKPSLFAMLGDDGGDDDDDDDHEATETGSDVDADDSDRVKSQSIPALKSSKKSKKKKKKAKAKAKAMAADSGLESTQAKAKAKNSSGLDEIDQALLALNLTANGRSVDELEQQDAASAEKQQLFTALSIDNQHLHAANEMKKLFGRAALHDPEDQARPRQRGGGAQGGIAAAIARRNAPGNRNLASIGLRRNIFIQGKEEWPRATSGGLGMEIVEKRADGSVEYRYVHNSMYQEVQQQFQKCVGGMDPDRMVQLLQHNRKPQPSAVGFAQF